MGVIGEIYNINRTIEEGKKLVIPDTELGRLLPNLEGVNGKVSFATSEILSIECFNIDLSAHENFRNQCIERGFVIDSKTDGVVYEAYNSEGYRLRISYYDNNMRIRINARIQMRKIQWPNTGISKLLPIPKSDLGKISYSSDKYLTIYIGNTSLEEFTAYINECVKRGFTEEMRQYHNDYFAKNKDGVSLSLRYEGYQIMYIDLHEENR